MLEPPQEKESPRAFESLESQIAFLAISCYDFDIFLVLQWRLHYAWKKFGLNSSVSLNSIVSVAKAAIKYSIPFDNNISLNTRLKLDKDVSTMHISFILLKTST